MQHSNGDELRLAKAAARREARGWYLHQLPVAVVVLAVAIAALLVLKRPWSVTLGGAGLVVSTLAAYWLAASLFPKDDEVREMDTIGGLTRSPAVLREREKARYASVGLAIGFLLQYGSLLLPA